MTHFSAQEYGDRLAQTRDLLPQWGVDGLLVVAPADRRWLSGFTGSAGRLLVGADHATLATDFRYWDQARAQAPHFELFNDDRTTDALKNWLQDCGLRHIGIDGWYVTLHLYERLKQMPNAEWHVLDAPLGALRAVKSDAEIALITQAASLVDGVIANIGAILQPGRSERAAAWELEKSLREEGAESVAFEIIVASGPNAAFPHHRPGDRLLRAGEPIIVDVGAAVGGYRSDLTRTYFIGEPDDRFRAVYELVRHAQRTAIDGLLPGLTGQEADSLARDVIAAGGYGPQFGHGLGHGVGLQIHEKPSLSQRAATETLAAGMVVTVEPGIYIPEWGGVRIEDLALLTPDGARLLSHAPYRPEL